MNLTKRFSKKAREERIAKKLGKQLEKESKRYKKYEEESEAQNRINSLKKNISILREKRKAKPKRKVRIGGFDFEI